MVLFKTRPLSTISVLIIGVGSFSILEGGEQSSILGRGCKMYIHACMHTHICMHACTHMLQSVHTPWHANTHTHTHTHTHTQRMHPCICMHPRTWCFDILFHIWYRILFAFVDGVVNVFSLHIGPSPLPPRRPQHTSYVRIIKHLEADNLFTQQS